MAGKTTVQHSSSTQWEPWQRHIALASGILMLHTCKLFQHKHLLIDKTYIKLHSWLTTTTTKSQTITLHLKFVAELRLLFF